ncbi:transporter [Rhodoferax sp.]|uniref:transporter n=1 Tax=Rhodoferax sp. TaxID=50421 RepID=UPI0039B8B52B
MQPISLSALALVAMALPGVGAAQSGSPGLRWNSSLSASHSSGDYGTPLTSRSRDTTLGLSVEFDQWELGLRLPYLEQTSLVPSAGGVRAFRVGPKGRILLNRRFLVDQPLLVEQTVRGVGDVTATLTRSFHANTRDGLSWDLGAQVKLPVSGADKDLSTGQADYSLLAGATKPFGDFSLGANVGYTIVGKPYDENYRNTWSGGLDASWRFMPASRLGLSVGLETSPEPGGVAARSVSLTYSYRFNSGLRVQASLTRGGSDGAPDRSGGLSVSYGF